MTSLTLIIVYSALSLITLFFFFLLVLRMVRKRRKKKEIPLDILNDYQLAESRWQKNNGEIEPNTILWDIAKSKRTGSFASKEQGTGISKLPELPPRRQSFQNNFDTGITANPREPERIERDNRRGFLRRRK